MQYSRNVAPLLGLAAVATLGLAAASPAQALNYTVTDLLTLGGDVSGAFGINNLGQLIGASQITPGSTVAHGFLYSASGMSDLGALSGSGTSTAQGINDSGQIVGYSDNGPHAFFYSGGKMNDLGTLGGATSYGLGIDSAGQSVGYSLTSGGNVYHAFATTPGETQMTVADDIGTLGGASSYATAISPISGQVAGFSNPAGSASLHAFIYDNGSFTDLGTLPGGSSSLAYGINDSGQVTGFAYDSNNNTHAFLYSSGTGMFDLGTLGGSTSSGQGINKYGEVVGDSKTAGNASTDGFIYSNGKMTDLNTLLDTPGYTISDAYAINDEGQIAAMGLAGGQLHALLLKPAFAAAPEPSAAVSLALGALLAAGLVLKAKRRSTTD